MRRNTIQRFGCACLSLCVVLVLSIFPGAKAEPPPQSVVELWKDWNPRTDPLNVKVVRTWDEGDVHLESIVYAVGTFKGVESRVAAFYAAPRNAENLPGLVHIHGGGQRANLREVTYYAKRGYACLSVNWGGREMEKSKPGDANTDWGKVDPTQKNVPGYFNLKPGEKYLDDFESPRNNNWYLLTMAVRRGLTFLEKRAEVDAGRLGVYGHSMGGNLTVYVAGTDNRVKVASPSVGGSGFRTYPWPLLPQQHKLLPKGDVDLFRATLAFQSYAKHVRAPLLWLGATNDFHGIMDDTYRTGELIPHKHVRYAFAPHFNHRFTPDAAIARTLWIDQHLKQTFRFPGTPKTDLLLDTTDHVPMMRVTPDISMPIDGVDIYYAIDADPQARYWRSASSRREGDQWSASLPLLSIDQPLFAFANVRYRLKEPILPQHGKPVQQVTISSLLHTAPPKDLRDAGVRATDTPSRLIEDFTNGWRDWYTLNADNPHHWQYWTRKNTDPKWRGGDGEKLAINVKCEEPNTLVVVVTENFFRSYRGRMRQFAAEVKLAGGKDWQTISLSPNHFRDTADGEPLKSWAALDELGIAARHVVRSRTGESERILGTAQWRGPQPQFQQLRWE